MPTGSVGRRLTLALILLASAFLVLRPAQAAFTDTASVPGNSFTAGTVAVTLTDNTNTAMFTVTNLKPGDATLSRCVTVTNNGDLPLQLSLYSGTTSGTGLGSYLNLSVLRGSFGTPPAYPACTTFTSAAAVYAGTLAAFPTTAGAALSDGGGTLAPGASRVFQFDLSLQDNSAAQAKAVTLPFTFAASQ